MWLGLQQLNLVQCSELFYTLVHNALSTYTHWQNPILLLLFVSWNPLVYLKKKLKKLWWLNWNFWVLYLEHTGCDINVFNYYGGFVTFHAFWISNKVPRAPPALDRGPIAQHPGTVVAEVIGGKCCRGKISVDDAKSSKRHCGRSENLFHCRQSWLKMHDEGLNNGT